MPIKRRWLVILYYSIIFCIFLFPATYNIEFIKSVDLPYSENSDFFTMIMDHSNLILTFIGILTAFVSFVSVFGKWLTSKLLKDVNTALEIHKEQVHKMFAKQDKIFAAQNIIMNNITNEVKYISKSIDNTSTTVKDLEEQFNKHLITSAQLDSRYDERLNNMNEKIHDIEKDN